LILVLERGRVVERGTHDALLAARGAYYRLHTAQDRDPLREGVEAAGAL
jgi:ATP-binding cassette subfamily B protein